MSTVNRFYRRGQFLLGPPKFAFVDGWNAQEVVPSLTLCTHPDLSVCQARDDDKSLTLLGQILDPRAPSDTNADILQRLCTECWKSGNLDHFPRLTDVFFGRWVIVATSGADAIVVHDAAGQRQVHFLHKDGTTYCASQAGAIADYFQLQPDPEALRWRKLIEQSMGEGFHHHVWWPGDRCLYAPIRRLLPNNSLRLPSGEVRRYCGRESIDLRPPTAIVPQAVELLQGALRSAKVAGVPWQFRVQPGGTRES